MTLAYYRALEIVGVIIIISMQEASYICPVASVRYCCCRLYVLYKLPQLRFLDSSAFTDSDRVEARHRGPYLGIVRLADDIVPVICAYHCTGNTFTVKFIKYDQKFFIP